MNYKEAKKLLKKIGTSKAIGEALAVMYADLIVFQQCFYNNASEKLYDYLKKFDDKKLRDEAVKCLRDGSYACGIVWRE